MFKIVIVTHKKYYELLKVCLDSLDYGKKYNIVLVVNDSQEYCSDLKQELISHKNITVLHYLKVYDIGNYAKHGWRTQQLLKLHISEFIDTEWYIIIDSDQEIDRHKYTLESAFENRKAKCRLTTLEEYQKNAPHFYKYARNAYQYYMPESIHNNILSETPLVTIHTSTAKWMMQDFDNNLILTDKSCEFHLYWAFLKSKKLDKKYYVDDKNWGIEKIKKVS